MYEGLNVGCGPYYLDGWLNTDVMKPDEGREPDLYLDIMDMPEQLGDIRFDKIYLGHVLEHIPWEETTRAVEILKSFLNPGGQLMVVGPCLWKAVETDQPMWLLQQILNDPRLPDSPGTHKWPPTTEFTMAAVQSAGWTLVEETNILNVHVPEWPNRIIDLWQCAILATK